MMIFQRLAGRNVYVAVANINAILYSAFPGRVKEYDEAVCSLLIDPLSRVIGSRSAGGALSARTAEEAPDHVIEYDNTGLGQWKRLPFYDITSDPGVYRLLGFQPEEIDALDGAFMRPEPKKSLMDQVREEQVATFVPPHLEGIGGGPESSSMRGVFDILRRWTGESDFPENGLIA